MSALLRLLFIFVVFKEWRVDSSQFNTNIHFPSSNDFRLADGSFLDGLGAVSGGGATSKLLVSYPEPYRSQILDYLFLPNFGASLHILKVEIGGDAQSTEGTEASHMHNSWEENYNRGYEWWLMKEAKKRNPYITLYGLPWGFPGWVSNTTESPYIFPDRTANYVAKWVFNAKKVHGLDIDYLGIWNEREHNVNYIKVLRRTLDQYGLQNTKIAVADNSWSILMDLEAIKSDIYAIGVHYPGTESTDTAKSCGLPLWSAEDYSTYNNDIGSGCLARILNQNYVNGRYTSTVVWNLVAAYYDDLPFPRCALMNANSPWSGNYEVNGPIWMMAHTTQFTKPGWFYVPQASVKLNNGGSIVTLTDPTRRDYTFILESMSYEHSACIRPSLPFYKVSPQTVNIVLNNTPIEFLHMWMSTLRFGGNDSSYFVYNGLVKIPANRTVSVFLDVDTLITLSTVSTARKGKYPPPPSPTSQPLVQTDDFESYNEGAEPAYLTPQVGSMEVVSSEEVSNSMDMSLSKSNKVLKQTVLQDTVNWCTMGVNNTIALMGDYSWRSLSAQVDFNIPSINGSDGIFIGSRIDKGGCDSNVGGFFFWIQLSNKRFAISGDLKSQTIYKQGEVVVKQNTWNTLSFNVTQDSIADFSLNGNLLVSKVQLPSTPKQGFFGLGTYQFGVAYYDNLKIVAYRN